ncbi:MAG: hypothetical protein ACI9YT_001432 [Halobacteriales archaeon]|jgi:hypothetical protein
MNVDIEQIATFPMESDDWVTTVLIGGAAMLFSFFVVPIFLVSGYLVKVLRAGMEGATEPPAFDDWGETLKEGLVAAVIGFIYMLVPLIVAGVSIGGAVLAFLSGTDAGVGAGFASLFGGLFLSWILSIVFGIVGLAGVANYARERQFGAGFDFGVITDVVTHRSYLLAWVYVIVLNVVVGIIAGVLGVIPFLGPIVTVFLSFYALVIAGWLWGQGFAEAADMGTPSEAYQSGRERDRRDSTESY